MTSVNDVFGGHLTLPRYEIVDCGAFCEVILFYISPKNLLGDFFYRLNTNVSRGYSYIKQSLSRFRRRALALNGPCSHYAVATCNVRLLLLGEDARVQEVICRIS